jgi:hypothetical protein
MNECNRLDFTSRNFHNSKWSTFNLEVGKLPSPRAIGSLRNIIEFNFETI